MGKGRELKAIPSLIDLSDGESIRLDQLTLSKKKEYGQQIMEQLEMRLEYYFKQHPQT